MTATPNVRANHRHGSGIASDVRDESVTDLLCPAARSLDGFWPPSTSHSVHVEGPTADLRASQKRVLGSRYPEITWLPGGPVSEHHASAPRAERNTSSRRSRCAPAVERASGEAGDLGGARVVRPPGGVVADGDTLQGNRRVRPCLPCGTGGLGRDPWPQTRQRTAAANSFRSKRPPSAPRVLFVARVGYTGADNCRAGPRTLVADTSWLLRPRRDTNLSTTATWGCLSNRSRATPACMPSVPPAAWPTCCCSGWACTRWRPHSGLRGRLWGRSPHSLQHWSTARCWANRTGPR